MDSQENIEFQFGKNCLILENLRINFFFLILMDIDTELATLH